MCMARDTVSASPVTISGYFFLSVAKAYACCASSKFMAVSFFACPASASAVIFSTRGA